MTDKVVNQNKTALLTSGKNTESVSGKKLLGKWEDSKNGWVIFNADHTLTMTNDYAMVPCNFFNELSLVAKNLNNQTVNLVWHWQYSGYFVPNRLKLTLKSTSEINVSAYFGLRDH